MKTISIKQPWAWLVCGGYKTVENRTWKTNYRGPLLIHAPKRYDQKGLEWLMRNRPFEYGILPELEYMQAGGIVGYCHIVDVVTESDDPLFSGPYGFVIENPSRLSFIPTPGRLRIFNVDIKPGELKFR